MATRALNAGHSRAQELWPAPLGPCERCDEAEALDRHHIDGNEHNNVRENVRFLCRRCHMIEDKRLEDLLTMNHSRKGTEREVPPCIDCGDEYKPLRRGRCKNCDQRKRYYDRKAAAA